MNQKITKTEFEKWGAKLWQFAEIILDTIQETPEEKAQIKKVISAFCVRIASKNTFVLELFSSMLRKKFEQLSEEIRETKLNCPCENGEERKMTGEEWGQYLHQRVEDHHKTKVGKDIEEQDLPLIDERLKKISVLDKDKEKEREQLLLEIYNSNKEDYDLVYGILDLEKKFFDITEKELFSLLGNPRKAIQNSPYLFEDLSQILFKAQEEIGKEKPKAPEKKNDKKKEEKEHQLKTLEEEIKELERQKKDLKEKLSNHSLDPTKKASLEEDLEENKKQREAAQARLDNLQRELKNTNNDSKNNLAIGLGIFAAVIAVICLIILLVRPRQRNQY